MEERGRGFSVVKYNDPAPDSMFDQTSLFPSLEMVRGVIHGSKLRFSVGQS